MYIPRLPDIKNHFRLQMTISDPGNKYKKLYDNPARQDQITTLMQKDAAHMQFPSSTELCGDTFFKLMHRSRGGNDKLICRFGLNTSFLRNHNDEQPNQLSVSMDRFLVDPDAVRNTPGYQKSAFAIKLVFEVVNS